MACASVCMPYIIHRLEVHALHKIPHSQITARVMNTLDHTARVVCTPDHTPHSQSSVHLDHTPHSQSSEHTRLPTSTLHSQRV